MDSVRAFACSRTMWSRASGSWVGIRTRSFEERFCVIQQRLVGRVLSLQWPVHTANVARSFGRYFNSHSAQPLSE
jgi:hypothetical protein